MVISFNEFVNTFGRRGGGGGGSTPWLPKWFCPIVVICAAWAFVRKPVYINSCSYTKSLGRYRFFSGIVQGKFSLFKQPTQQQKVGNCIVFFAFSVRRDGGSDSMSEKLCTKGKRKLHSHSKQIIMDLKALPYGQSTQALLRLQVCLCLSRIPSPQLAASHFSTPALTQVFPKCSSSKLKSPHKPSPLVCQCTIADWNYSYLWAITWAVS